MLYYRGNLLNLNEFSRNHHPSGVKILANFITRGISGVNMDVVNIDAKFKLFDEPWQPRIVGGSALFGAFAHSGRGDVRIKSCLAFGLMSMIGAFQVCG